MRSHQRESRLRTKLAQTHFYIAYALSFAAAFYPTKILARWSVAHGVNPFLVLVVRIAILLLLAEQLALLALKLLRKRHSSKDAAALR